MYSIDEVGGCGCSYSLGQEEAETRFKVGPADSKAQAVAGAVFSGSQPCMVRPVMSDPNHIDMEVYIYRNDTNAETGMGFRVHVDRGEKPSKPERPSRDNSPNNEREPKGDRGTSNNDVHSMDKD
jgi:hypothetical protein